MMHLDEQAYAAFIGRSQMAEDVVVSGPMRRLAATLDRDEPELKPGEAIPPSGHWLLFLPHYRQSEAGPDGHAARGGFLPPVPLPRRMWAGGRLTFTDALRVGDTVTKTSTIKNVQVKNGRTGALCFVLVEHRYETARGLALLEEHDIVYRGIAPAGAPAPAYEKAPQGTWRETVVPTDLMLFRYSALTFNGHRIHYDRKYVTQVEGYPGLIFHGPLQATMLMDLAVRKTDGRPLTSFSFRAIKPVFDLEPLYVCGQMTSAASADFWVEDFAGDLCMKAQATF
ncbi:MAG: FAS1-like dehydratase domain-containing protein [Beijerinckiaceae bacterium]